MPERREVGRVHGTRVRHGIAARTGPDAIRVGVYDGRVSISVGVETAQLDAEQMEDFTRLLFDACRITEGEAASHG